jgi:hypothetical protein
MPKKLVLRVSCPASVADRLLIVSNEMDDIESVIKAACEKTGCDRESLWAKANDADTRPIAIDDMESVTICCNFSCFNLDFAVERCRV